jgi:hypothetical protein
MALAVCAKSAKIQYLEEMMMNKQDEYFLFLDVLRDSGVTNMLGATPYLLEQFEELDKNAARKVLGEWMDSKMG